MFERERTDTDAIDFDFFDDAPTEVSRDAAPPQRRRRLPTRPPTGGPTVRLAALFAGAIALIVAIVVIASGCQEGRREAAYKNYMGDVGGVGRDSQQIGSELNELIFSAGIQIEDLRTQLDGLREAQSQTVERAQELDPPGPLREQHESLVESLQLRVSGLNGLARAFSQITETTGARAAGALLAEQSDRLVASDVVYEDLFKATAQEVMAEQDVTGVAVPDSNFVTNAELTSPASWRLIVERLMKPPAATGGLRGNGIEAVRVLPGEEPLSEDEENTVQATERLAFEVLVENSGENQETQVKVSLTIQQSPEPIRKEQEIDAINPGDTKAVVFSDVGQVSFGPRVIVKVTVEPVAGEENTNNNTFEAPVIFTFG